MSEDPDAERLLRAARPAPPAEFVRRLEADLHETSRPRLARGFSLRPAAAAVGLAGVLAAFGLSTSLAGFGPLAGGNDRVEADQECRIVFVTRQERKPVLVTGADEQSRIEYREQAVRRPVKRCG